MKKREHKMELSSNDHNWRIMYRIGMFAIFLSVFVLLGVGLYKASE